MARNTKPSNFLIAAGATTNIPTIEGLDKIDYLTNVSLFDLEEKPESLTIMGAGYIGLEIAMAYNRLGVKVRIIEFTDRVLRTQTQTSVKHWKPKCEKKALKSYLISEREIRETSEWNHHSL